jgi:hypothetical protein
MLHGTSFCAAKKLPTRLPGAPYLFHVSIDLSWSALFQDIMGAYSVLGLILMGVALHELRKVIIDMKLTCFKPFSKPCSKACYNPWHDVAVETLYGGPLFSSST